VATAIDIGNPLMHTKDERIRIHAVLKHLGSGGELREFPATASEKVALVKTASQRKLIVWHRGRNRYELASAGWCELAPSRRFGVGSMMLGTTIGATLGAAALGVFWLAAGASHGHLASRSAAVAPPVHESVATLSGPAVSGASSNPAPIMAVPTPTAVHLAAPVPDAVPAAAPAAATEPPNVADLPAPEPAAEAAAKAKLLAAKKARQRAASRRRREEAARAWAAAEPWRGESSGYGGRNSWFAYR
jgi:hypothetical protein